MLANPNHPKAEQQDSAMEKMLFLYQAMRSEYVKLVDRLAGVIPPNLERAYEKYSAAMQRSVGDMEHAGTFVPSDQAIEELAGEIQQFINLLASYNEPGKNKTTSEIVN